MRTLVVFFLFLAPSAHAELVIASSLEWKVASSDLVVVATVEKLNKTTLRLTPTETIRGVSPAHINLTVPAATLDRVAPRVMAFLTHHGKTGRLQPREDRAWGSDWVVDLKKPTPSEHGLGRDFVVLKTGEAIVARARTYAKSMHAKWPRRSFTVDAPWETEVARTLYGGSAVELIVPADAVLETSARGWAAGKDESLRRQGAQALALFKSAPNIKILSGLLADRAVWTTTSNGLSRKVFYVRKAAYDALSTWGVKVKRPIIEH